MQLRDIATHPGADGLFSCCAAGDGSPQPFYLRCGFELTGEVMRDEDLLGLDLRDRAPAG